MKDNKLFISVIEIFFLVIILTSNLNFVSSANYQFQNTSGTNLMVIYGANGNVSILNHLLAGGFINSSIDLCTTSGICLTGLNSSLGIVNNSLINNYIPYTGANKNVDLGNNNLTINGSTLFVNTNTGKVGIGTTSPTQKLEVNGNANITQNLTIGGATVFTDITGNMIFRI